MFIYSSLQRSVRGTSLTSAVADRNAFDARPSRGRFRPVDAADIRPQCANDAQRRNLPANRRGGAKRWPRAGRLFAAAALVATWFSLPSGADADADADAGAGAGARGAAAIAARQRPGATITVAPTVNEGDAVDFVITLETAAAANVDIDYVLSGRAAPGDDYLWPSGQVTVLAGETTARITIETYLDDLLEGDETFAVTVYGSGFDWPSQVAVTMLVDRTVPGVEFSPVNLEVPEGTWGSFGLRLSVRPLGPVTVTSDDPNAPVTANFDTTNWSEWQFGHQVFAEVDGGVADTDQFIAFSAAGGGYDGVMATMQLRSLHHDGPSVSLTGPLSVDEGQTAEFEMTLDRAHAADTYVRYVVDGLAIAGDDYEAPSGELLIPMGNTSATVEIPTFTDNRLDPGHTIELAIVATTTTSGFVKFDATPVTTELGRCDRRHDRAQTSSGYSSRGT